MFPFAPEDLDALRARVRRMIDDEALYIVAREATPQDWAAARISAHQMLTAVLAEEADRLYARAADAGMSKAAIARARGVTRQGHASRERRRVA